MKNTVQKHSPETGSPWQVAGPRTCINPERTDNPSLSRRLREVQLIACVLLATVACPAFAQDNAAKLSEALKEIEALKSRLAELEKVVRAASPAAAKPAGTATQPVPSAPSQAPATKLDDYGLVKWNELSLGKSKIKLYGFLRLDSIFDDSRPNNTQVPAFIRSEDPAAPPAVASAKNSSAFNMHPKLTRFGLDFTGPEVESLWGAKTGGKLEIDFYNANAAESREVPRMRHAYLKLSWEEASLLAGQTSDLISPLFPVVNPDFVMWGAGNLGDRRPQLRGEYTPKFGKGKLFIQGALGLTGADDNQDLDANGFRDGDAGARPTLQGRIAYAYPVWEKCNVEFGVWAHRAWERSDTAIGTLGKKDFDSDVIGLDLTVPLYKDILSLKAELWQGRNLDDVRGGILQGINTTTGQEVHSKGGFAELGLKPTKWYSLHAGYSFDDPKSSDIPTVGATVGRTRNSVWYGAIRGYFDPIEIGLDYLNWTTKYNGGFGKGDDNRFQAFISYKF